MNKKNQTLKDIYVEALSNYKNENFKNTELLCYKILSIDPNHVDSIALLAAVFAMNRNFVKAKEFRAISQMQLQQKDDLFDMEIMQKDVIEK